MLKVTSQREWPHQGRYVEFRDFVSSVVMSVNDSAGICALFLLCLPTVISAQQVAGTQTAKKFANEISFDQQVAPIFVSYCLECHSNADPEGGLSLADKNLALQGGDSGKAFVSGEASASLLWEQIDTDEMPPEHPLSNHDKAIIKKWIDQGAKWGASPLDPFAFTTETRAGRDWWALKRLRQILPPQNKESNWGHNDIDAFTLRRLLKAGLHPSPQADPRALIRRLYFDLLGLPPTPGQVTAFAANPSNEAYQRIVDGLLSSKHYGERWGRHWLDIVRFGESDGFERNFPRENAWPYRDWVINAFNSDMPYDKFVKMQLIGDQLTNGIEGAAATGFWVAGVHNTTVGGSKRMKQLARQDEIEEVLSTVGQAFIGLTLSCARCHEHKFDPVTQKEYYQLASAISGLGYGERVVPVPGEQEILKTLNEKMVQLQAELTAIDQKARHEILKARKSNEVVPIKLPVAMARWEFDVDFKDSIGNLHGKVNGNARLENGSLILDGQSFVDTAPIPKNISDKTLEVWLQLDNSEQRGGGAISIGSRSEGIFDAIVFGEQEPNHWMAGSNSFIRTESFAGPQETVAVNQPVHIAIVYQKDGTIICYRDGIAYGQPIHKSPLQNYKAGDTEILFGLRHKPPGGNRYLKAKIFKASFYDRALNPEQIAASAGNSFEYVSEDQIVASLGKSQRNLRKNIKTQVTKTISLRNEQVSKANRKIYTLSAGKGAKTNVLLRGNPDNIGEVVKPGAIASIQGHPSNFNLPVDAPEADRRQQLAQWITHKNNPLFSRVLVNRLWHYHFGVGIVDTPNDFGFNGGRPSHPELLEYLAWQFQTNGYRMKSLHRLIVNSSTYRQATHAISKEDRVKAKSIDSNNRLLWRGNMRRLEAESLRDAILTVSGKLNTEAGGPSFKDVSVILNSGTTYYEPIDVEGPEFWQRTIYRFNPRGGRSALLDTFDCPDSATTTPRRSVTSTPLQSLSLMNNAFVLQMSHHFAERVKREAGQEIRSQVTHAWQLAVARKPSVKERLLSSELVSRHGLAALCRGLFNFNEFVMIE